jgi:hypothetical protein
MAMMMAAMMMTVRMLAVMWWLLRCQRGWGRMVMVTGWR